MSQEQETQTAQRLFDLINAAWTTRALAVAAELRLAEALRGGPRLAEELAAECQCDAQALFRLLRALVTVGAYEQRTDGRFALLPLGALLGEDSPQSLRAWALQFGRRLWPAWGALDESVRTGKGLRERMGAAHGFSHLLHDSAAAAVFNQAMVEITRIVAVVAVQHVDLRDARSIVDVGGGHGQLLAAFLEHWPQASGTVLDLEHAAAGASEHFQRLSLADRASFQVGDFFVEIPSADVLLMKAILHDWDDDRCSLILRNARRALAPRGRLIVLDRVLPDRMSDSQRDRALARSDLTMLVGIGGRERTEREMQRLLAAHGFAVDAIEPLPLGLSLLACKTV